MARPSQDLPDPGILASVESLLDATGAIYLNDPRHYVHYKAACCQLNLTGWLQRFMKQLLIGCSNPACFTNTCRTYRETTLQASFRPYTTLSARMIASLLVKQDCPEKYHCPFLFASQDEAIAANDGWTAVDYEPAPILQSSHKKVSDQCLKDMSSLTTLNARCTDIDDSSTSELVWSTDGPTIQILEQPRISNSTNNLASGVISSSNDIATNASSAAVTKDPKSLTQNVFDTLIMRNVFTEIPSISQLPDTSSLVPVRSLPHFTSQNVTTIIKVIAEDFREEFRHHGLFRSMGRKFPLFPSSTMKTPAHVGYLQLLAYLEQSIYYVCSSFDALMQSFRGDSSTKMNSDHCFVAEDFSQIVETLASLYFFDVNFKLLSSLHTIAKAIEFPRSVVQSDHSDLEEETKSFEYYRQISAEGVPDDREVAHIIRIILAALIGTIILHNITPAIMEVVSTLRFAGSRAPLNALEVNAEYLQCIRAVQDAFEDGPSVSLIVRLATAIGSRICLVRNHALRHKVADDGRKQVSFLREVIHDTIANAGGTSTQGSQVAIRLLHGSIAGFVGNGERAVEGPSGRLRLLVLVEWLRTVLLKEWDGKVQVLRNGPVGGALEFLRLLHEECQHQEFDIPMITFCMLYIVEKLDPIRTPVEWAADTGDDDHSSHLLSYMFLFPPATLVSYFRAINYDTMKKAYDKTRVQTTLLMRMTFPDSANKLGEMRQLERVRANIEHYLVIDIKRDRILGDAMDQLWRRKAFELQKPLKVRLGMTEGEEGIDHGGVQQEFFRLAIAEALNPEYGLFTTDPTTRMSWFQPLSLEPLYKFELIGILFSLALYNGLTLPCTMPLAFYRRILKDETDDGAGDRIADIQDGWPELAKGLQSLQQWTEGDVQDVFMRTYTFSVNVFGSTVNYDIDPNKKMQDVNRRQARDDTGHRTRLASTRDEHYEANSEETIIPDSNISYHQMSRDLNQVILQCEEAMSESNSVERGSSDEMDLERDMLHVTDRGLDSPTASTQMVTNANRDQYIRDYVHYLTDTSVGPQFSAFMDGFWRCLNKKSMALLTPPTLKSLVEGYDNIDTHELCSITKYEGGYTHMHSTILDFWDVVHHWAEKEGQEGQTKVRKLLEFVTASDRLPVDGVHRIAFVIQKNGEGDARLPTSLTCFGRLLLPEYSGREALRKGIERVIEEAKGFGQP